MSVLDLLAPSERSEQAPDCPYAPLIGSWEIKSRWFSPDGSAREAGGESHFTWVMGGWGVQDILFETGAPPDQRGTSIRCYDAPSGGWRVVWMTPRGGEFVSLLARTADDRILQEGEALDGSARRRWTFSNITADTFFWQGEHSLDGGTTWTLDQEMRAIRRPPDRPTSLPRGGIETTSRLAPPSRALELVVSVLVAGSIRCCSVSGARKCSSGGSRLRIRWRLDEHLLGEPLDALPRHRADQRRPAGSTSAEARAITARLVR